MKITDVFFDLDHTLWDFEKNSALAFETVLSKHGVEVPLDDFLHYYVPLNIKYWELYRVDAISQEELRYGRLKDSFDALGVSVSDEIIDRISEDYIAHLPLYNHLFDGTVDILDYLKTKYRLHIITNGFHQIQEAKLRNSNIFHYFDTVTHSETAGVKKPNPLIFQHAMKRAGTTPEASLMIGDCIEADVRGAMDCGMNAIHFCEIPSDGVKTISRLEDLKQFL